MSGLIRQSWVIFRKELTLEFRTLYGLNAIAMFALTTLAAVSFAIGPIALNDTVLASLLWIILFFSAMTGLAQVFVREEEQQTADMLRLAFLPNAVLIGKWLFNLLLLATLMVLLIPLFMILMGARFLSWDILIITMAVSSLALATVGTIIASIISVASTRGALFAVLAFPIALPILIAAISSTRLALEGAPFSDCLSDVQMLFSFTVVIATASLMVFEFVWKK